MKKKLLIVSALSLATVIFAMTILIFNQEKKKEIIKIGYQEISLYQHIFIAKEKGYFKDEGIDVELLSFASGNQIMEAFLSSQIDVMGLTNTQVALTIEGKQKNKLKFINFLVWEKDAYPDYVITRKNANIKKIKDLEGKNIGLHPGSAVRAFSTTVFKHFNLDQTKIATFELKPEMMQSTLIAGKVDAVYCMDPVATTLLLTGLCDTLIANPMQYIFPAPTPISGTVISSKIINEKPDTAKKIVRAIDRAIKYSRDQKNKKEIAIYISKYTPVKKEQVILMNPSYYWTSDQIKRVRVQALADKFYTLKIIDKKINTDNMIYDFKADDK